MHEMLDRHLIYCHTIIYWLSIHCMLNSMIKEENGKMFDAVSVRQVMFSNPYTVLCNWFIEHDCLI
jgi:hypothetical protein